MRDDTDTRDTETQVTEPRDAAPRDGRPNGPAPGDGDGAAISPRDTATGRVRPTDGPMERAGTEAEARERGEAGAFEGRRAGMGAGGGPD